MQKYLLCDKCCSLSYNMGKNCNMLLKSKYFIFNSALDAKSVDNIWNASSKGL
jgi:hypothetical protein